MNALLKIGTRGSKLALAQARWVKAAIEARLPGREARIVTIRTTGDKILDVPLSQVGGKGLFVKEIETALLAGDIDIAVHSLKDVPSELPPGLTLAIFPAREDPRDALISRGHRSLAGLAAGARVGTSSLRRAAQLRHVYPELTVVPLRGNVDTRLAKLTAGEVEAVILAAAGLKRLGLAPRITRCLEVEEMLPAIGQGVLGIEMRAADRELAAELSWLNDPATETTARAERGFLSRLEGGCQVPLAAFATLTAGRLRITGLVSDLAGRTVLKETLTAGPEAPEALGRRLAERLLDRGAGDILACILAQSAPLV